MTGQDTRTGMTGQDDRTGQTGYYDEKTLLEIKIIKFKKKTTQKRHRKITS